MPSCAETRRLRPLLGTFVEIRVRAEDGMEARAAIESGFAAVARVHALMSFQETSSDVARLNARARTGAVRVHPWTRHVIAAALDFSRASGGDFDCAVAPVLVRHGPRPKTVSGAEPAGNWRDIELLDECRIRFARPLAIDLGGIAKGFAVDRAIEAIHGFGGVSAAAVNAGGDLRLFGPEESPIYVRDPVAPQQLVLVGMLRDGALATSAAPFGKSGGAQLDRSPFIDPRTRQPVRPAASVSVIAPDAITADALTKPVLLRGPRASAGLLARYHAQAVVVDGRGQGGPERHYAA